MMKAVAWVVLGVLAGAVITKTFLPVGELPETDTDSAPASSDYARELARLENRLVALEMQVGGLVDDLEISNRPRRAGEQGSEVQSGGRAVTDQDIRELADLIRIPQAIRPDRTQDPDWVLEQLTNGGFPRERAEWIVRRTDELTLELVEARYEAERSGSSMSQEELANLRRGLSLRDEIGDAEFERYLSALGRETTVPIMRVLEDSPAARAGLVGGDHIVTYGGRRIFGFQELTPLTLEYTTGESVIVDILRNGQPMQVVVPGGPLGLSLDARVSTSISGASVP